MLTLLQHHLQGTPKLRCRDDVNLTPHDHNGLATHSASGYVEPAEKALTNIGPQAHVISRICHSTTK
jgi:hypothetical protein